MTTVVDALILSLGLDISKFVQGADAAAKAQKKLTDGAGASTKAIEKQEKQLAGAQTARAKDMEARAKVIAQGLHKVRTEALGLLAIFTAGLGLKNYAENTIVAAAGLDRMSTNLSMSAKDLSMWQLAAKNAGGSAEGMTEQLKDAAVELARLQSGGGSEKIISLLRWGAMAGVDIDVDKLKTGTDVVLARARVLEELNKIDPSKAMLAASEIGVGDGAYPLLKQGAEATEKLRQAQAALAEEMAKAAKPAEELRQRLDRVKNQVDAISVRILVAFMPRLDQLASWIEAHKDDFTRWFDVAAKSIGEIAEKLDKAADSVGGWKNVLIALLALKVASFATDALVLAAALAKVGVSLATIGASAGVIKALGALGLLLYSGGLNKGEDEELKRRRAGMPGFDASGAPTGSAGASNADANPMFSQIETKYGLPSGLLDKVWLQESSRGKNLLSPKGAKGHFGFMDATAKQYGLNNPNDLGESADAAGRMYRDLLKQYGGNLPMALAGYNWGSGNLAKHGFGAAPPETRNYIDQITRNIGPRGMPNGGGGGGGNTSTSQTTINGPINIVTQATDAPGIAKSIGPALDNLGYAGQADMGYR
jgi:hypothetical protein